MPERRGVADPARIAGGRRRRTWFCANNVISGLVKRKTTSTSISVVRPRVKANPRTAPIASTNSTRAESMETVSAIKIVCRARRQPVSTAVRRLRPSRTSSRMRSKKITKLSAVIPMATIAPAMPGRLRANPTELPSSTIQA